MSAVASASSSVIDFDVVKTRQQAAWSAGNYAVVGTTLQIVGDSLCEALDLRVVQSPALWGTKSRLDELFEKTAREIQTSSRQFTFRYGSPEHWIDGTHLQRPAAQDLQRARCAEAG